MEEREKRRKGEREGKKKEERGEKRKKGKKMEEARGSAVEPLPIWPESAGPSTTKTKLHKETETLGKRP